MAVMLNAAYRRHRRERSPPASLRRERFLDMTAAVVSWPSALDLPPLRAVEQAVHDTVLARNCRSRSLRHARNAQRLCLFCQDGRSDPTRSLSELGWRCLHTRPDRRIFPISAWWSPRGHWRCHDGPTGDCRVRSRFAAHSGGRIHQTPPLFLLCTCCQGMHPLQVPRQAHQGPLGAGRMQASQMKRRKPITSLTIPHTVSTVAFRRA